MSVSLDPTRSSGDPPLPEERVYSRRLRMPASTRNLALLFRRVGIGLQAGLDVRKIWEMEQSRGSAQHRQRVAPVLERIKQGDALHEAMAACDGYFPPLALQLVKVGEHAGRTEEVLLHLADHYDHLIRMRREFLQGIAWPAFQLGVAILVVGLLIWLAGILPIGDILGLGLVGGAGLATYFGGVGLFFGFIALVTFGMLRGWFGPAPLALVMRVPLIGGCLRTFALARFSWALAMSLNAGVDARESMRLALAATHNTYFASHGEAIDKVIERGGEFHEALRLTNAFPDEFVDTLEAAELSGTHSESLERISRDYQERAQHSSRLLTRFAGYLVWAMVAALLVFLIMKMAMTYVGGINDALKMIDDF